MSDNLIEKYIDCENRIKAIKEEEDKIKSEWLTENCPLNIGDVVTICGYSHRGKQGRVTKIWAVFEPAWREHNATFVWRCLGTVLKKDGTEGNQSFDFDQWQYKK